MPPKIIPDFLRTAGINFTGWTPELVDGFKAGITDPLFYHTQPSFDFNGPAWGVSNKINAVCKILEANFKVVTDAHDAKRPQLDMNESYSVYQAKMDAWLAEYDELDRLRYYTLFTVQLDETFD